MFVVVLGFFLVGVFFLSSTKTGGFGANLFGGGTKVFLILSFIISYLIGLPAALIAGAWIGWKQSLAKSYSVFLTGVVAGLVAIALYPLSLRYAVCLTWGKCADLAGGYSAIFAGRRHALPGTLMIGGLVLVLSVISTAVCARLIRWGLARHSAMR